MVAMLWVRMRRPVRENRAGCVDDISPFHSTRPGRKKSDLMSLSNPRIHAALLQSRAQGHVLQLYSTNLTHAALPVQHLWDRSSVRRRMSTGPRASRRSRSRRCRSVCWSVCARVLPIEGAGMSVRSGRTRRHGSGHDCRVDCASMQARCTNVRALVRLRSADLGRSRTSNCQIPRGFQQVYCKFQCSGRPS